jgi:hypothetical protein
VEVRNDSDTTKNIIIHAICATVRPTS